MARMIDNLPVTASKNMKLTEEMIENCKVVYKQHEAGGNYCFYGLYDDNADYDDDCIIVPIKSTGCRVGEASGVEYANIIGTSDDKQIRSKSWTALLEENKIDTSRCMTDGKYYNKDGGLYTKNVNGHDLVCKYEKRQGGWAGAHVYPGKENKQARDLKNDEQVAIIPTCFQHNKSYCGSPSQKVDTGTIYYMRLHKENLNILYLIGAFSNYDIEQCENAEIEDK